MAEYTKGTWTCKPAQPPFPVVTETGEAWVCQYYTIEVAGQKVAECSAQSSSNYCTTNLHENAANAQRIVDCVNYCSKLEDLTEFAGRTHASLIAEVKELQSIIDNLMEFQP